MDVFAHTIWANALAQKLNEKRERSKKELISVAWTSFWGVFPDLFAFTASFLIIILNILKGNSFAVEFSEHGGPSSLAYTLYNYSHSIVIWAIVFTVVWIFFKKPKLVLLGWLLHIIIDIPSHSINFYPTPFLWPISDYKFPHGVSWANLWFMIINYTAMLVVFLYFIIKKERIK